MIYSRRFTFIYSSLTFYNQSADGCEAKICVKINWALLFQQNWQKQKKISKQKAIEMFENEFQEKLEWEGGSGDE